MLMGVVVEEGVIVEAKDNIFWCTFCLSWCCAEENFGGIEMNIVS